MPTSSAPPAAPGPGERSPGSRRRVVFVAGSGRSGTSTVTGALQQLGMHVPRPEVQPDESNPKGFAESQWVVDFHDELLGRAGVAVSDARPQAWLDTDRLTLREQPRNRLHRWLEGQFADAEELVIKDPRLAWFIGLWKVAAIRSDAQPAFVTMLRSPTEVISSKERHYGGRQGNAGRTAAWINMMLHTERATRGSDRAFIRYEDLLSDWTSSIYRLGETFDLHTVKNADTPEISRVHEFIDPSLNRTQATWNDIDVPVTLRELAQETYSHLNKLAVADDGTLSVTAALDELRSRYTALYAEAEAIARSSITAARLSKTRRGEQARNVAKSAEPDVAIEKAAPVHPDPVAAGPAAAGIRRPVSSPTPPRSPADRLAAPVPHSVRSLLPAGLRRRVRDLVNRSRER